MIDALTILVGEFTDDGYKMEVELNQQIFGDLSDYEAKQTIKKLCLEVIAKVEATPVQRDEE